MTPCRPAKGNAHCTPKALPYLQCLESSDGLPCVTKPLQTGQQILANYNINPYPGCFFLDHSKYSLPSLLYYHRFILRTSTRSHLDPCGNPLHIIIDLPWDIREMVSVFYVLTYFYQSIPVNNTSNFTDLEPQLGPRQLNETLYQTTFMPHLITSPSSTKSISKRLEQLVGIFNP